MTHENTSEWDGVSMAIPKFNETIVALVWSKGCTVPGYDSARYRKDACGAWMDRARYGDTSHVHGWEIDHVVAAANGGGDGVGNLQPLQWENNRAKADGQLRCIVVA